MSQTEERTPSRLDPPHAILILPALTGFGLGLSCWLAHSAWRRRTSVPELAPETSEEAPVALPEVPIETPPRRMEVIDAAPQVVEVAERPLESLANSIGRELANLATAVQGNAQLLCEVTSEPELLPSRCEYLWAGVHRLRLLTDKLLTFSSRETLVLEPLNVDLFLAELRRDIESVHCGRITVQTSRTKYLPSALAHRQSLQNAVLFVVEALFETEPRSRSLSLAAIGDEHDDSGEITMRLEICAETETPQPKSSSDHSAIEFGYLAARRSLEAQHASLKVQLISGISATGIVTLEAISQENVSETIDDRAPPLTTEAHEYGGVLVLERDAPIRDLIATEVERFDRKILTALDAASAKALLDATPERFEMLILDGCSAFEDTLRLARIWLTRAERPRILILARADQRNELTKRVGNDVSVLCKPFGALELRTELGRLLGIYTA